VYSAVESLSPNKELMRIGIVPTLSGLCGGVYQYRLTTLRALHKDQL
jgi:hypothetical protein